MRRINAVVDANPDAVTELVAAVAGRSIAVCGYRVTTASGSNANFEKITFSFTDGGGGELPSVFDGTTTLAEHLEPTWSVPNEDAWIGNAGAGFQITRAATNTGVARVVVEYYLR